MIFAVATGKETVLSINSPEQSSIWDSFLLTVVYLSNWNLVGKRGRLDREISLSDQNIAA